MTDDMIRALAAKGGVMQINFGCEFLSQRYFNESKPLQASMREQYMAAMRLEDPTAKTAAIEKIKADFNAKVPSATLADVVAQIDPDLDSYNKFPALTRALLEKGYSAPDIKKIYGENLLRVMRVVEQRARELKSTTALTTQIDK
jgi:membrane dipeptidase